MRLAFHPAVDPEINRIRERYRRAASSAVADDFYRELTAAFATAARRPRSFGVRDRGCRRVNLPKFPYNFLFRIVDDTVLILVVRHHHRRPSYGTRRR